MGKSSKDKRDAYYRLAKEQGYRARSAYKLLQLDEQYNLFKDVSRVVDLCAAPGSWSQVLAQKLRTNEVHNPLILALDLQPMAPIPGVIIMKADITHSGTRENVIKELRGQKAQLVVCDGAPDVTGLHDLDSYIQFQLLFAALSLSLKILENDPKSTFVAKIFRGRDIGLLYSQLSVFFSDVQCAKPRSSRGSSIEAFVVCRGFRLPADWKEDAFETFRKSNDYNTRVIIPFVACGDLSGFDADATYADEAEVAKALRGGVSLDPVRPPTDPPYKKAIDIRRAMSCIKLKGEKD